jgi:hypothetical protein
MTRIHFDAIRQGTSTTNVAANAAAAAPFTSFRHFSSFLQPNVCSLFTGTADILLLHCLRVAIRATITVAADDYASTVITRRIISIIISNVAPAATAAGCEGHRSSKMPATQSHVM